MWGPLCDSGLVDIHTHLFHTTGVKEAGRITASCGRFSFRSGITTMVDAGAPLAQLRHFPHTVIDRVKTRVLAMVNIAGLGMMTISSSRRRAIQAGGGRQSLRQEPRCVVGVKSAHYQRPDGLRWKEHRGGG